MRKRSLAREITLQCLYQIEITGNKSDDVFIQVWEGTRQKDSEADDDVQKFAFKLLKDVLHNKSKIDDIIESCADHWELDRMAIVDRNILRIGSNELLLSGDVPVKVAINEAIELAKKFGDSESWRFVNGVLDQVAKKKA